MTTTEAVLTGTRTTRLRRRSETARPSSDARAAGGSLALWALAFGAFVVGCTEFMVVGLVPEMAVDLGVSQGAIGQLVTLNAVAVAFAAPLLGAAFAGRALRPVMVLALAAYAAAHALAAAAPSYEVLLASRLITGAAFGLFLATAFAAAARLAGPGGRARALATVQGGVTTATALGVPLHMILGQAAGWRLPFVAVAAAAVLATAAVALRVPALAPDGGPSLGARLRVLGRRPVALGIATIALFWAGSLCAFTYLVPLLGERTGLSGGQITGVLLLAGAMSIAGNALGGRGADRALAPTLLVTAGAAFAALAALLFAAPIALAAVILVALWQLGAWTYVPAITTRIYEVGGATGEAAVSFSVAAFNVGIVVGAGLGGIALDGGGLVAVMAVATALAAGAFALTAAIAGGVRATA